MFLKRDESKTTHGCSSGKTKKADQVGKSLGMHCSKAKKVVKSVCRTEARVKSESRCFVG
jgi:hypothetical protein